MLYLLPALLATQAALAAPTPTPQVFAMELSPKTMSETLSFPTRVIPKVQSSLLSETDGVVSEILAPLGTAVKKGQLVMKVKHTDPVYRYADVEVRSRIAGIVAQMDVTEGAQVTRGAKLAVVTDPQQVRLSLEVPAADLSSMQQGLEGEFKASSGAAPVKVRVRGIAPSVDAATATASAELEVLSDKRLPVGLIGQSSFQVNTRQGYSVPEHAVFYKGDQAYIRTLFKDGDKDKAKHVAVNLGAKIRGNVEILSGVTGTVTMVERTSKSVADGDVVEVKTPEIKKQ